jgi:hypothetical protein
MSAAVDHGRRSRQSAKDTTMAHRDELQTIDPAALAQVSGGAATTPTPTTTNDQLLTALTGILDSIQSLAKQNTGGGFNQQEMFLLMMMMQQRNQQAAAAAAAYSSWSQEPIIRYY